MPESLPWYSINSNQQVLYSANVIYSIANDDFSFNLVNYRENKMLLSKDAFH